MVMQSIAAAAGQAGQFITENAPSIMGGINAAKNLFGTKQSSSAKAVAQQYKYNLALQQQAQGWSEYAAKNAYVWDRESKEKAGLNRLYGLSTPGIPGVSSNSIGMPETVSEESSKRQQALELINNMQNWSAMQVQKEKTEAETRTENIKTLMAAEEKISKELDNLYKKKELNSYEKRLKAELEVRKSEVGRNLAAAAENRARAENAKELTKTEIEERKPIEARNEWHKLHPKLSNFITGSREMAPEISKILGTAALAIGGGFGAKAGVAAGTRAGKAAAQAFKRYNRGGTARKVTGKVMKIK